MKNNNRKAIILLVVMVIMALAGCGSNTAPADTSVSEKTFEIVLHHPGALDNPYHHGVLKFQELVEERSNGSITFDIHPNNEFHSGAKSVEALQMGTLDIVLESSMSLSNFVPEVGVLDLPFIFESKEKAYKILDGEIGKELSDKSAEAGLKILTFFENGYRNLSNSKRAINAPEDLQGLKIRVPESKVFIETFKTLGAIPTPMAFGELYTALNLGTVDGQENPCSHLYDHKLYEVQKYFAVTNHIFTAEPLMIRTELFNEMSENQQKIILESAQEAAVYQRRLADEVEKDYLKKIEETGIEITYPDMKLFQKAVASVYEQFRPQYGDMIDRILAAQED